MLTTIAEKIKLSDGNQMPGYGFGCYKAKGEELISALAAAWEAGYRLFDTAAFYENEETVASGLATRPVQDYFLVSKIWPTDFPHPVRALDLSLKKLGRDYLDGYLLHWPGTDEKLMLTTYEKLMKEQEKGKIHSLGCSNFLEHHLDAINREFGKYPALNQIESHPAFSHKNLTDFCQHRKITVMAWAPLGRGKGLENPDLEKIANEVNKTVAQVILRWQLQGGKVAIPKSVHAERIFQNAQIFDFSLSASQMAVIDSLDSPEGATGADPDKFNG